MSRDETLLLRLASEITSELAALGKLRAEAAAAPREAADSFSLRARASILHDFYTGIERIFLRIAEELNGGAPRSEQWHRQLLLDMALEIPSVRPAVVSGGLRDRLQPYLRFRHLFRNLYGYILDPARMGPLEAGHSAVHDRFVAELQEFVDWLRTGTR